MEDKKHDGLYPPRYIVFTYNGTDVLVCVRCKDGGEECPSQSEVDKMREAVTAMRNNYAKVTAGEAVTEALRAAGYIGYYNLYFGELCRVEL